MSSDPAHHLAPQKELQGQRQPEGIETNITYKFSCPDCGQRVAAPITVSGIHVACPECSHSFLAPSVPALQPFAHAAERQYSSPKRRRLWFMAVGAAAILTTSVILTQPFKRGPLSSQVSTNAGADSLAVAKAATIGYWNALEKAINVEPQIPDMAYLIEKKEFEILSGQWQRYAAQKRQVAAEIRNLRTINVDESLGEHGLKMADLWADAALFCDEGAQLAIGFRNFHGNYNSGVALAENFVRGALGDNPLNKMREGQVEMERLKAREASWNGHGRELDRLKNALLSERTRLRATLSRKFGIEL